MGVFRELTRRGCSIGSDVTARCARRQLSGRECFAETSRERDYAKRNIMTGRTVVVCVVAAFPGEYARRNHMHRVQSPYPGPH